MNLYLNGNIRDKYRHILTGNSAITDRDKLYSSTDQSYFYKYENILRKSLTKTNNLLFSMDLYAKNSIYNPFGHYSLPACFVLNWDWIDFFRFDINKLINSREYDYMVLLPGWWKCKEAWKKLIIAKVFGINIIALKKLIKELS